MDEKILAFEEFDGPILEGDERTGAGFRIRTSQQTIALAIASWQGCCEEWGYFMSEDDLAGYVGARLYRVTLTDTALKTCLIPANGEGTATMFVNLETDRGVLQFVAYNAHNGYYGHDAWIVSERLTFTDDL